MSGGVDSSTVAAMLRAEGQTTCVGLTASYGTSVGWQGGRACRAGARALLRRFDDI